MTEIDRSIALKGIRPVTQQDILDKVHQMRLQCFGNRTGANAPQVKPYLPVRAEDEKAVIMEQYFQSKKELNQKKLY